MAIIKDTVGGVESTNGANDSATRPIGQKAGVANGAALDSASVGTASGTGTAQDNRGTARRQRSEDRKRAAATIKVTDEKETVNTDPGKTDAKKSHKKKPVTKVSASEAAQSAHMLIEMVQLFTTAQFGKEAEFSDFELMVIEPSLGRLLEKYGNLGERFGGFFDPALVVFGAVIYGNRIGKLANDPVIQRERANRATEKPSEQSTPAANPDPIGYNARSAFGQFGDIFPNGANQL